MPSKAQYVSVFNRTVCTAAECQMVWGRTLQVLENSKQSQNTARLEMGQSLFNLTSSHTWNCLNQKLPLTFGLLGWRLGARPTFFAAGLSHPGWAYSLPQASTTFTHSRPTRACIIKDVWQREQHRWPTRLREQKPVPSLWGAFWSGGRKGGLLRCWNELDQKWWRYWRWGYSQPRQVRKSKHSHGKFKRRHRLWKHRRRRTFLNISCLCYKRHLERDLEAKGKIVTLFVLCSESRVTGTLLLIWLTLVWGSSQVHSCTSIPSYLPSASPAS